MKMETSIEPTEPDRPKTSSGRRARLILVVLLFAMTVSNQASAIYKSAPEPFPGFSIVEGLVIVATLAIVVSVKRK
jgi:hypothetical protein